MNLLRKASLLQALNDGRRQLLIRSHSLDSKHPDELFNLIDELSNIFLVNWPLWMTIRVDAATLRTIKKLSQKSRIRSLNLPKQLTSTTVNIPNLSQDP